MEQYLERLLAGEHGFQLAITHVDGTVERAALLAVDGVGLVLDSEGGAALLPWTRVARCYVEYC